MGVKVYCIWLALYFVTFQFQLAAHKPLFRSMPVTKGALYNGLFIRVLLDFFHTKHSSLIYSLLFFLLTSNGAKNNQILFFMLLSSVTQLQFLVSPSL